jgi:hypothetical protein
MCCLRIGENPRDRKKCTHVKKVFISLKICNSNYFSAKILIHNENHFDAIIPTSKKENNFACMRECVCVLGGGGEEAKYSAVSPWYEYSRQREISIYNSNSLHTDTHTHTHTHTHTYIYIYIYTTNVASFSHFRTKNNFLRVKASGGRKGNGTHLYSLFTKTVITALIIKGNTATVCHYKSLAFWRPKYWIWVKVTVRR